MAAIEKLLVQIFEKKTWIVNQAKHQAYLFEQRLASKCLIDGIAPPPWLFSSSSSSLGPNNNQLKQDPILGGPLPWTQPEVRLTGSRSTLFDNPVPTTVNWELPNGLCTEERSLEKGFSAEEKVSDLSQCPTSNVGCVSNGVPQDQRQQDAGVTSPEDKRDARTPDIYQEPALSLDRVQRSKSRQRALEIRNTANKSCSRELNKQEPISEGPLPWMQPEVHLTGSLSTLFDNPLPNRLCTELHSFKKGFHAEEKVSVLPQCPRSNVGCVSNGVPQDQREEDDGVTSLEDQRDARTPDSYQVPALSLDRVQRSKSRQRALEIRNSASKSFSRGKNIDNGYAGGAIGSAISSLQPDHVDELNLVKGPVISDKNCVVEEAKVGEFQSKECSADISYSKSHDTKRNQISGTGSVQIERDLDICAVNSTDSADIPHVADNYACRMRSTDNHRATDRMSQPVNAHVSVHRSGTIGNSVSSVNQTSDDHKDANVDAILENGPTQNISLIDYPNGLQLDRESSVEEGLVKQERMESNLSDVTVAESAELVSEENALDSYAVGNSLIPSDSDFAMVSSPCSVRNLDAENLTIENACAKSLDETNSNLARLFIRSDNSPGYGQGSIINNSDVDYLKSAERQIVDKSKSKGRICSSSVEGSWPQHKQRNIMHNAVDDLSASPGLIEKVHSAVNRDSICGDLGNAEPSPNAVLQSQGLSVSREDVVKSIVSKSAIQGTYQTEDHYSIETYESSPKAQMKQCETNLGSGDESAKVAFTFMHEAFEESLNSSMTKQAPGTSQDCLMEKTAVVNPTGGDESAKVAFTFMHEAFEESLNSSMRKQDAGTSRDCLMEETAVVNPTGVIIDAGCECTQGSHASLPLGDSPTLENVEHLTCNDKLSYLSVGFPCGQSLELVGVDDTKPELEGFVLGTDEPKCFAGERVSLDQCNTTLERASILEQICKSACMQTPVACSSASHRLHKVPGLYASGPTRLLEGVDMRTAFPVNFSVEQLKDGSSCLSKEIDQEFDGRPYSGCLRNYSGHSVWDIKIPSTSPVGKSGSSTSGSRKRQSVNPELPCIGEEIENTDEGADTFRDERVPLADINENSNLLASVSKAELYENRFSLDSVNTEFSFPGTHKSFKQKLGVQNSSKRIYKTKQNLRISQGRSDIKKTTTLAHNRFNKQDNIVSSMTSFIPLVQQKQESAVITGKRDIKVKALEAAEAAKRIAEKKEHARKIKKEALKLERSRMEQENIKQLELQTKKKEEERKKKLADLAAAKRQREEDDKKERERKRLRVETRRQQRGHEVKLPAEKEGKERKFQALGGKGNADKEFKDVTAIQKVEDEKKGYNTCRNISETDPSTSRVPISNSRRESSVHEEFCESPTNFGYSAEVLSNLDEAVEVENSAAIDTSQEQSYEISPFKESDDEDEDEDADDVIRKNKFTPSWSSKTCLALAVSNQSGVEPESIFPPKSFCSISEVLLPRMHQLN